MIEVNNITLKPNRAINKTGYRRLDSWGMAVYDYVKSKYKKLDIKELSFIVIADNDSWTPDAEALKRRISYLAINNKTITFKLLCNNHLINLYEQTELFERPDNEVIHDVLNKRRDNDKGDLLEKAFQAFLFGKGLGSETRTNDRLAILGEHFFKLKRKKYGVLREFPTGAFLEVISEKTRITPTEFVDIVTLNNETCRRVSRTCWQLFKVTCFPFCKWGAV